MSQDSPPTDYEIGKLFLPEWVTEIFYGKNWYPVQPKTYREIETDSGDTIVYKDAFSKEIVILLEPVTGWKIKQPEPEEPKATVTELHPKK